MLLCETYKALPRDVPPSRGFFIETAEPLLQCTENSQQMGNQLLFTRQDTTQLI